MRKIYIILIVFLFSASIPQSVWAETCFESDKTNHCLTEPFEGYWKNNGGLPVFGYPITSVADETNRDTGAVYPTQWVERNRLEYHVENAGTPYEILLGLLGKERLAQLGRDWASEPREAGPKEGCLWFDQTGHNVCNQQGNLGFKTYWENHGLQVPGLDSYARSLQLFGLPLTEPKMETNAAGDTVLTQWFERARFEWHPNNPDEFKVLLGLLGREVRDANGGTPPPAPQPTPEPTPVPSNEVTILSTSSYPSSTGSFWIAGEVQNNTSSNVEFVKIVASYYDTNGTFLASSYGFTDIDILVPGQRAPFTVLLLDAPANIHHYDLQVQWRETDDQPLTGVVILNSTDRPGSIEGWHYIAGQVRNDSGQRVRFVKIVATLYNADGVVVGADYTYSDLDELDPAQVSPYEMLILDWNNASRYELQVQARPIR